MGINKGVKNKKLIMTVELISRRESTSKGPSLGTNIIRGYSSKLESQIIQERHQHGATGKHITLNLSNHLNLDGWERIIIRSYR